MLQVIEHSPAAHIRQANIERDGVRFEVPGEGQGRTAAQGHQGFETLAACSFHQYFGKSGVILDDQQHGVAGLNVVAIVIQTGFVILSQFGRATMPCSNLLSISRAIQTRMTENKRSRSTGLVT